MRRDIVRIVTAVTLAGSAVTCAGAPRPRPAPATVPSLTLEGEFEVPASELGALQAARFGGVSALAFDRTNGDLLGLSDDSNDPRVFVFRVSGEGPSFKVDVHGYFPLPVRGSGPAEAGHDDGGDAPVALDPEGMAVTSNGRVFISSEGLSNRNPRVPPGIYEYSRHVQFVRALGVPAKFLPQPEGPITRGVRSNAAFESLTLTPDDTRLFTATESAILQDGPAADFAHAAPSRIIEYEVSGDTYAPRREFAYFVDPVARPDFSASFSINGLVELLAFSETDLLAMERSYAEESADGRRMNRIRIYRISLEGATDVSHLESLPGAPNVTPVRKTLVLDFAGLRGLSPKLRGLDNFEGLTFGPRGPSGPTLIAVSDDNFSLQQHTAFLLLRWTRMTGS